MITASLLALLVTPLPAWGGWREASERVGAAIEAELRLTHQAAELQRAMEALEREQAGAEYGAAMLDHAAREGLRRLGVYRAGAEQREGITRRRARAMVKAARGGVARLVLEDVGEARSATAERLSRGRDLRWLVRRDLKELSAYQRAERRARAELLDAERQLQALSGLTTLHDVEGELFTMARRATHPALQRAHDTRRSLWSRTSSRRVRRAHRDRLAELSARWEALQSVPEGADDTLVRPVKGALVGAFGAYEDPVLRLPMTRNGVELAARRDESVHAPAGGRVVMVAELPGFDHVVVVDHGDGRMSMLGRLWKVQVSEGDVVEAGDVLASVAPKAVDDGLGTTAYLELRHGDEPVDPAPLLPRANRRTRRR